MRINVMWFRRDLRLEDNAALYHALKGGLPVLPLFIFDRNILDKLEDPNDRRVAFIHAAVSEMNNQLLALNSGLYVFYGLPNDVFETLTSTWDVDTVYTNHDYEPYAKTRDLQVSNFLKAKGIQFKTYKDQVIFEKSEVVKDDLSPYTVFTPYSRKWKATLNDFYTSSYPTEKYFASLYKGTSTGVPSLESMGFKPGSLPFPRSEMSEDILRTYDKTRDFPAAEEGTSRLGVHLRFGTVSIRTLVRKGLALNQTYLNELIWREFYQMILWHFPKVGEGHAFKSEYEHIKWRNNEQEFERWCAGNTGYPIVDAGMRQLNATGFMHNRVRMVVASFLTKHLLIDWRWGEAYFAQKLLDYDLASNNGGWQWAAGSGVDAAPYFRIFNPQLQTKKFDAELKYIRKWVPEFEELTYAQPIVQHEFARKRALQVYAESLKR